MALHICLGAILNFRVQASRSDARQMTTTEPGLGTFHYYLCTCINCIIHLPIPSCPSWLFCHLLNCLLFLKLLQPKKNKKLLIGPHKKPCWCYIKLIPKILFHFSSFCQVISPPEPLLCLAIFHIHCIYTKPAT